MVTSHSSNRFDAPRIVGGLTIILVGLAFLAGRLHLEDLRFPGSYWPFLLIALGAVKLAAPDGRGAVRARRSGGWLVYVGAWGALNEFHLFGFDYANSWPLLIVGAGVAMVWCALEGHDDPRRAAGEN